jgi:hypothetical protein
MKTLFIIIFFITCFNANCKVDTLSLTRENVELVIKEMGLHHEDIVMRQAILETGNFKSHLAKKGNLFGLRHRKGYYHYKHWSESIAAYRDKIQKRYKKGEDYYQFLKRIKYAEAPNYVEILKKIKL